MSTTALPQSTLWQRIAPRIWVFDGPLLVILLALISLGLIVQYSAAYDFPGRWSDQFRNILIAMAALWIAASIPPHQLMRLAVPVYIAGVLLLIGVALFGDISKGARRWLHIGVTRIQPSELMKIAVPLLLAWLFHKREAVLNAQTFFMAVALLAIPSVLILKQPDLGTALLVISGGFFVIFFAGLSWKIILGLFVSFLASLPLIWSMLHDYQRQRVLTLLDPTQDPLGKGFHILQSIIAVGSGGVEGKGFMEGTQTHLEFIPERTTDFIFAVYAEEFGLIGNVFLMLLYIALIGRGLMIAAQAPSLFGRLFAGAISLIFFTYAFVNIGMVSGVLPIVGVPLPWISYGGTALVTLGMGAGFLMSIHRHRPKIQ